MKYDFHINDYKMIVTKLIKNHHKDLIQINDNVLLGEDKSKIFIDADYFIKLVGKEIDCNHLNPVRNYNRKVDITISKQNKCLEKWGLKPVQGVLEHNQRVFVISNYYSFYFQVVNKNKLRSFISKLNKL